MDAGEFWLALGSRYDFDAERLVEGSKSDAVEPFFVKACAYNNDDLRPTMMFALTSRFDKDEIVTLFVDGAEDIERLRDLCDLALKYAGKA